MKIIARMNHRTLVRFVGIESVATFSSPCSFVICRQLGAIWRARQDAPNQLARLAKYARFMA
jgi:hypothetical protein